MKLATISIVSHGHSEMVTKLIGDLCRQTIADRIRVVLTLNIPEVSPSVEACGVLDMEIIHNPRAKGFGANHNMALAGADTPWVLVVNPDVRLSDPKLLEELFKIEREKLGLVAPVIVNSSGTQEDSIRSNIDPISIFVRRFSRARADTRSPRRRGFFWVAGMFMLLPLQAWQSIGGFDERFFLYCEDYDLCARLVMKGYAIEVAESLHAIHDAQRSSRKSFKYMRWHMISLLKVWTSTYFWRIWASDAGSKIGLAFRINASSHPTAGSRRDL